MPGERCRIVLARHGRPARPAALDRPIAGREIGEWYRQYDRLGLLDGAEAPAALREEIKRVAAAGTAYDDAEFNHELRCIAAPVRNFTQQTIAAFGISGPVWRVTLKDMQKLGTRVASMADDLSRDLGFRSQAKKPATARAAKKRA